MRKGVLLLLLIAGVLAAPVEVSKADHATGMFGVFQNGPSDVSKYKARFDQFNSWTGRSRSLDVYKVHVSHADGWDAFTSPFWIGHLDGLRLSISLPPYPLGGSAAGVLNGSYDGYYRTLADNLIARGHANAHLVLAHELNGDWFHWGAPNVGASTYIDIWRKVRGVFMARAGAQFKWDWNIAIGMQQMSDPTAAYPGDAYVDVISMDMYDEDWEFLPSQGGDWYVKRWNKMLTRPFGLDWLRNFAAARGKPISFPEWGLTTIASRPQYAGGDNPYFIRKFHDWVAANNVLYHAYHDSAWVDGDHRLRNGCFEVAAQEFQRLFDGDPGTAPTGVNVGNGGCGSGTPPEMSIGDVAVWEGDEKQRMLYFPVTLTHPAPVDVRVDYRVTGIGATRGVDYRFPDEVRTLVFRAGSNNRTPVLRYIAVPVLPDKVAEPNLADGMPERVVVTLSNAVDAVLDDAVGYGYIHDDEGSSLRVGIPATTQRIAEGNVRNRPMRFVVTLSRPATTEVTVDYRIEGLTATAGGPKQVGADFNHRNGSTRALTFRPGQVQRVIVVPVYGDQRDESNETFRIVLSNARGATLSGSVANGLIVDDD